MTGSLQIKNDKYYAVINMKEGGKRKQKWISLDLPVKGNKRKADQKLRVILIEEESKYGDNPEKILFSDFIKTWLNYKKNYIDELTFQSYEQVARIHVIPYFEKKKIFLQELTTEDIQQYADRKMQIGRSDNKGGLSPCTMRLHKNVINQTLDYARKRKYIKSNPCDFLELPPSRKPDINYYSPIQLENLIETFEGDPLRNIVYITTLYGLRRSEVLGLRWDSINFDNDTLEIKYTVSKVTKEISKNKTKPLSSHRTYPLLPQAKEIFLKEKAEEESNERFFGKGYDKNDYVFKWPDGHRFSSDYVSQHFTKIVRRNGLASITFHGLRHSCASMLVNDGFNPKDIQEWLGHSDVRTTMNIYGHLDSTRKKVVGEAISKKVAGFGGC